MNRLVIVCNVILGLLLLPRVQCLAQAPIGKLANGLQVYCISRPQTTLCTIDLWVRAGSRYERSGEYGCAHFLEHVLFDGSTGYPDGAADIAVETLGGIMNAATGPDYAHFYTTVPRKHAGAALEVMATMLSHALIPPVGVERERKVILDELALRSGSASDQIIDAVYASAFPNEAYGRSPGGTPSTIMARTRSDIIQFYKRRYQPQYTNLVMTGDVTSGEAISMASVAFGSWRNREPRASTVSQPRVPSIPSLDGFSSSVSISELSNGRVAIAYRGPKASDIHRSAAMQLMREILNHDPNFGLDADDQLQAHGAVASYAPRLGPSLFVVSAALKPGDTVATAHSLLNAIKQAVDQLSTVGVYPSVAAYAAKELLSGTDYDTETLEGLAYNVGYAAVTNGEGPISLIDTLHDLPLTTMKQVGEQYLNDKYLTVIELPKGVSTP